MFGVGVEAINLGCEAPHPIRAHQTRRLQVTEPLEGEQRVEPEPHRRRRTGIVQCATRFGVVEKSEKNTVLLILNRATRFYVDQNGRGKHTVVDLHSSTCVLYTSLP